MKLKGYLFSKDINNKITTKSIPNEIEAEDYNQAMNIMNPMKEKYPNLISGFLFTLVQEGDK